MTKELEKVLWRRNKMKRLIKNGDIILDGTKARIEKEKEAFAKLESIEDIEEELGVNAVLFLKVIINDVQHIDKNTIKICCHRIIKKGD